MTGKAQWTKKIVKDVKASTNRPYGLITYELSQAMTGHASFRGYLTRIGKRSDDTCPYCKMGAVDNPEHSTFLCQKWKTERERLEEEVGKIEPDNIISKMLRNRKDWEKIEKYIKLIMREKYKDEVEGKW